MGISVVTFICRKDNYAVLLHDDDTDTTVSIDAPEAEAIGRELDARRWKLTDILITHHHADHTEGIPALVAATGARVTGPRAEEDKISGLDVLVAPGDTAAAGPMRFAVLGVPGHTLGHIAYHDAAGKRVFVGDALFSLGVGRMIEGTAGPMWQGLVGLRALPDDTLVFCGHEYTLANAKFALSVDPGNPALLARAQQAEAQRTAGEMTVPSLLGTEKAANPFLRADTPELAKAVRLDAADPAAVFAALRKAKDNFS